MFSRFCQKVSEPIIQYFFSLLCFRCCAVLQPISTMSMSRLTMICHTKSQPQQKIWSKKLDRILFYRLMRNLKLKDAEVLNLDFIRKNREKCHKLIQISTLGRSRCTSRRSRTLEEAVVLSEWLFSFTDLFKSVMESKFRACKKKKINQEKAHSCKNHLNSISKQFCWAKKATACIIMPVTKQHSMTLAMPLTLQMENNMLGESRSL